MIRNSEAMAEKGERISISLVDSLSFG